MKFAALISATYAIPCDFTTEVATEDPASCIEAAWVATDNECDLTIPGCVVRADGSRKCDHPTDPGITDVTPSASADDFCVLSLTTFESWCGVELNEESNAACEPYLASLVPPLSETWDYPDLSSETCTAGSGG